MRDERNQELERLEQELLTLEAELQTEDELLEDLKGILGEEPDDVEPAFDEPHTIHDPKDPMIYRNFSNDYGREPRKEPVKTKPAKTSKKRSERVTLCLMITACCLTAGIIGVLMYWLLFLLK
jgi:hypothetical protein